MKKITLLPFLFCFITSAITFGQNSVPTYVPTSGLVGWWPFNGNLNDQSGNAYNGILTGGQYVVNRNGTASSALQFTSAATGYVDLNIGSTLTGQFSVMVWVRADRTSTFVSESGACPSTVSVPMANSNQNWLIRPGNLGTNFGVGISANQNGIMVGEHANNLLVSRLSHSINSTAFNQIVATYRSDSIFLYVNGIKVRSKVMHCPTSTKNIGSTVRFGGSIYSPNFAGVIDDIGIWNRSLTQAEITGLYNAVECSNLTSSGTISGNQTICSGGNPTAFISSTDASGGSGGTLTYQWESSTNGTTYSDITSATSATYDPPSGLSTTTYYRRKAKRCSVSWEVTSSAITVTTNSSPIAWANTQWPASGAICSNDNFNVYGQIYIPGVTEGANQGANVTAQLGYSTTNSNPSTWTNWVNATYNPAVTGNTDEYIGTLSGLSANTYYYAFRYSYNGCAYVYGGYSAPSAASNSWTINAGGGGAFIGSSTTNGGGSSGINSSNGSAFGLFNSSGGTAEAIRNFPSILVGQTVQFEMDNGWINNGAAVGVGLQNASGQNVWEIFFAGGASGYSVNGSLLSPAVPYTANGLRVTFTLLTATTYSATIQILNGGATYGPYTGTLLSPGGGQSITRFRAFNFNAGAGVNYNFLVNNIITPSFFDNASTYSAIANGTQSTTSVGGIWNNPTIGNGTLTVTTSPTTSNAGTTKTICEGNTVTLTSNVPSVGTGAWSISSGPNTNSNQLSSTSANNPVFTPTAAGTYVLRWTISNSSCTSFSEVTINSMPLTTPTFTQVGPYNSGASIPALPTISTNSITGTWLPAINNTATTTYTFTPSAGQCGTTTTMTITINQPLQYSLTANDSIVCPGTTVMLSVNTQPNYPAGTVHCNGTPTAVVDVTNPVTGKTWMDRNLGASRAATSSTDANAYGDLYQWGRRSDGHQCRNSTTTTILSSTDQPGNGNFIIGSSDWRNPQNNNLWQGVNGVNNPCPNGYRLPTETEINAERLSWSANTSVGAFASPLKLPMAGNRGSSNGSLNAVGSGGYYWSSTVSGTNSRNLYFSSSFASMNSNNRALGRSVRCIKETDGSIGAINCGSSTVTGNLLSGVAASSVSASVPYTGGNGGFYAAQSFTSTGVTGLTASISQGLFASGAGNLVYTISGTPSTDGTASFAINIGGKSCTLSIATLGSYYSAGSVFCAAGLTAIKDVTNPTTGKTWMDRNLGASRAATSSTDANSYGDLYQWGRKSDGHQCRNSATTTTLSSTDQPVHANFILAPNTPYDWRSPQNTNLWQGINGLNNPCPSGFRLPTNNELESERLSWNQNNSAGTFASPLKFPVAGDRYNSNGSLNGVGTYGSYWSSTVSVPYSYHLYFNSGDAIMYSSNRAFGLSVRCIKN